MTAPRIAGLVVALAMLAWVPMWMFMMMVAANGMNSEEGGRWLGGHALVQLALWITMPIVAARWARRWQARFAPAAAATAAVAATIALMLALTIVLAVMVAIPFL